MITLDTRTEVNPTAVLPRANLIPAAIHERAKVGRAKIVGASLVAGAMVITAGFWLLEHNSVSSAQARVDQVTAQNSALETQVAKYAIVPLTQSQLAAAQSQLAAAMATDIRFSYLLNDLSLTIPRNVALTQVTISVNGTGTVGTAGTAGKTGAGAGSPTVSGPLATGVGSISFAGTAPSYNAVADWLDLGLANSPAYANPFVTNVGGQSTAGSPAVVTFSSTLILTPSAYSHRFDRGLS